MIKEAIGFGETIEQAKENALENLAVRAEDDVEYEVLVMPKKKTLGLFGGAKAQVRAYIELPDIPAKKEKSKPAKKAAKPVKKAAEEKPVKVEKTVKTEKNETPANRVALAQENAVPASELPADSPAARGVAYISKILTALGCENIDIKVAVYENRASFYLTGDGLGAAIGHRGETLDALQYLTSLSANAAHGYYKVTLNIGDYREKREQTLISLAKRMSAQALRSGRSRTLEPMNPYERRIIHTAVQEIEGVSSHSTGEGSGRRVVISPDNAHSQNRSNRGGRSNRRPAEKPEVDNNRTPKKDAELPLYGKIN